MYKTLSCPVRPDPTPVCLHPTGSVRTRGPPSLQSYHKFSSLLLDPVSSSPYRIDHLPSCIQFRTGGLSLCLPQVAPTQHLVQYKYTGSRTPHTSLPLRPPPVSGRGRLRDGRDVFLGARSEGRPGRSVYLPETSGRERHPCDSSPRVSVTVGQVSSRTKRPSPDLWNESPHRPGTSV